MYSYDREQNTRIWRERIRDFLQSGMTRPDYCKAHDLNQQQFLMWLGRHYEASSNLIPVKVEGAVEVGRLPQAELPKLTLELPTGCKVTVHDASILTNEAAQFIQSIGSATVASDVTTV
jgi:hypothetical protein